MGVNNDMKKEKVTAEEIIASIKDTFEKYVRPEWREWEKEVIIWRRRL